MGHLDLINEIEAVFQTVEYPGDENLIPYTDTYQERYDMWLEFKGHWKDVSPQTVEDYRMSFSYFSPQGFQYYLPSLLISALDPTPYEIDSYLILEFFPPKDKVERDLFDDKMKLLNQKQKIVIKKFISVFFNENPKLFLDKKQQIIEYWDIN